MAQWNVNNLNLNDQTGILTIGQGHVLLNYLSLILTPPGPGGGLYSINVHQLSLLALAVSKKDGTLEPNPIDQATNCLYLVQRVSNGMATKSSFSCLILSC